MEPGLDRIRELRLEQGMSQRELARRAKVKRTTVRRIEKGTCRTGTDVHERFAEFARVCGRAAPS